MFRNGVQGPIKIFAVGENKFYFVRGLEKIKIGPKVFFNHATARAFDVHDDVDIARNRFNGLGSTSLDHDAVTTIDQSLHQGNCTGLSQGLAPSEFDVMHTKFSDLVQNLIVAEILAPLKPVNRIAPLATKGASRQANERARKAAEGSLALNAGVNLCNP